MRHAPPLQTIGLAGYKKDIMDQRTLHWIWRGAIAVIAGATYGALAVSFFDRYHQRLVDALLQVVASLLGKPVRPADPLSLGPIVGLVYFVPATLLALVVFGVLTRVFCPRSRVDRETRCRQCDYILRGITEPRCPECGERI